MTDIVLKQIGVVRSDFKDRKAVPRLGGPAAVEIFPEYGDGLRRIERHSHLWVLVWLDQSARDVLQVIPRGIEERTEANLHGVFSVRSPVRPNPIGLTLAKVTGMAGGRIELDRLDFTDGTPVIDLKPYFLSRDAVYAARNEQIGKPDSREALRESLRMQAENFHGGTNAELELAVDLFTEFRAAVLGMVEPRGLRITVPADRPVLADAFIGMARCTPGRGTLLVGEPGRVRIEHDGGTVEYPV